MYNRQVMDKLMNVGVQYFGVGGAVCKTVYKRVVIMIT